MTRPSPSRRAALRQLLALGAAGPVALNLTAIGSAAAQSAAPGSPYRALVCIFLQGGNDSNNLLLATDPGSWSEYWSARNRGAEPIALMPPGTAPVPVGQVSPITRRTVTSASQPEHWGGVLTITPRTAQTVPAANQVQGGPTVRSFALHPMLGNVQTLFNSGRLAAVANVGTLLAPLTKAEYQRPGSATLIPPRLFSHSDQQSAWQSGRVEGSATGWGGLTADAFSASNGAGATFSAVTTAGNTVFLAGATTRPFRINFGKNRATAQTVGLLSRSGSFNGSNILLSEFKASIQSPSATQGNVLMADYAAAVTRSVQSAVVYDNALGAIGGAYAQVPAPPAFTNPMDGKVVDNTLADQLQAVAETAVAHALLGVSRQVFFVQYGSFDTHDGQNPRQGQLLAELDHALGYFDSVLAKLGLSEQITTFTASDFNRTFTTNGDGTDHAWGGHHLVMGGAVKGRDIYGAYPTLGLDRAATATTAALSNPDAAGNAFVPTTSVDVYMATMATWLGVTDVQLASIFPRLAAFKPRTNLGFMG